MFVPLAHPPGGAQAGYGEAMGCPTARAPPLVNIAARIIEMFSEKLTVEIR
jgi:hypothetical protein